MNLLNCVNLHIIGMITPNSKVIKYCGKKKKPGENVGQGRRKRLHDLYVISWKPLFPSKKLSGPLILYVKVSWSHVFCIRKDNRLNASGEEVSHGEKT